MAKTPLPLPLALEKVIDEMSIQMDIGDGRTIVDTREMAYSIIEGLNLAGYIIIPKTDAPKAP